MRTKKSGTGEIVAVDFNDLLLLERTVSSAIAIVIEALGKWGWVHLHFRVMKGSEFHLHFKGQSGFRDERMHTPTGVKSAVWAGTVFERVRTHLMCMESLSIETGIQINPTDPDFVRSLGPERSIYVRQKPNNK